MSTMTASQIADLHARRAAKGSGYAPTLAECLAAAREGCLFDVDTANAGHDCLWIADDGEAALAEVAAAVSPDDTSVPARWTAERVTLDARSVRAHVVAPDGCGRTERYAGPDDVEVSTSARVDGAEISRVVRVSRDGTVTVTDTPQATGLTSSECNFVAPRGGGRVTVAALTDRGGPRVA